MSYYVVWGIGTQAAYHEVDFLLSSSSAESLVKVSGKVYTLPSVGILSSSDETNSLQSINIDSGRPETFGRSQFTASPTRNLFPKVHDSSSSRDTNGLVETIQSWHRSNFNDHLVDDNVASWNLNEKLVGDEGDECFESVQDSSGIATLPARESLSSSIRRMVVSRIIKLNPKFEWHTSENWRQAELELLRNYVYHAKQFHIPHFSKMGSRFSYSQTTGVASSDHLWVEI